MGKKCGIYCIENTVDHKKYIGQTVDIRRRWSEHILRLNKGEHCNTYLQRAWDKYTAEAFDFTLIEECAESDLDEREKYYIKYYQTMADQWGYNLTDGGEFKPSHRRPVIDYRTQEVYPSLAKVAETAQVAKQTVGLWCKERRNYMYYDEWQSLSAQEQREVQQFDWVAETAIRRKAAHSRQDWSMEQYNKHYDKLSQKYNYIVYCPELDEYFNGATAAHKKYGFNPRNITSCMNGRRLHTGTHPVTGEKLSWIRIMKE